MTGKRFTIVEEFQADAKGFGIVQERYTQFLERYVNEFGPITKEEEPKLRYAFLSGLQENSSLMKQLDTEGILPVLMRRHSNTAKLRHRLMRAIFGS